MTAIPAFVHNGRLDVLGMNDLARALYHPNGDEPEPPRNVARFVFLDTGSRNQFPDWESMAQDGVAILRQEAARDPHNRGGEGNITGDGSVHAVAEFYGPTDLTSTTLAAEAVNPGMTGSRSPETLLLGGSAADRPDLARWANPLDSQTVVLTDFQDA